LNEVIDGDADTYGEKGEAFDEQMGLEAGVACKQFIPPIPAQNGFYFSCGQPGKKPGGNKGGISKGFIETTVNGGDGLGNVFGSEGLVVVFGTHLAGDHFGKWEFVIGGFLESDREGVKFLFGKRGGQSGHGAGVDTSAEKNSDFHITTQLVADSFAKEFAGGLGGFIEGACSNRIVFDREVVKIFGPTTCG
jgi:hypothetical protein